MFAFFKRSGHAANDNLAAQPSAVRGLLSRLLARRTLRLPGVPLDTEELRALRNLAAGRPLGVAEPAQAFRLRRLAALGLVSARGDGPDRAWSLTRAGWNAVAARDKCPSLPAKPNVALLGR